MKFIEPFEYTLYDARWFVFAALISEVAAVACVAVAIFELLAPPDGPMAGGRPLGRALPRHELARRDRSRPRDG